ncbi:MAG: hypothetical protein E6K79_04610 [Candidatus Eisenbacteria bacterium]|uniref:Uncharacterized protein n=1 Tax=Eiseniibacteriota bacterium TaxID=2212470 RepID=A0A538TPW2_UNCEI|nr:MAG: hypothetical protein E6K79_04610 [Candidatus Eisenbacteria bacterium]
MIGRGRPTIGRGQPTIGRALIFGFAAFLCLGESARAQVEATPPSPQNPITSRLGRTSEERDRFELGVAAPDGYFDVVGTFAYRRFIYQSGQFEQSMQVEVTGMKKDYLIEGSLSLYYFLRPLKTFREEWRVRPLLEVGPGAHLVVQAADIIGFTETSYRARSYLKTHAYGGVEFLLTRRFGILVRGRFSVPAHHTLDYAQAAILLR